VRTEFTHQDTGPSAHAYDDPSLDALEFLLAVMHATNQPISTRIEAAKAALPYTNSFPSKVQGYVSYHCRLIIGGLEPVAEDPSPPNEGSQSFSPRRSNNHHPQSEAQAPQNLTRYSDPPTPEDIQQIKAAVQRLCPDADLSNIPEPRLCACGHWMFYPCKCASVH
jgi:hypothetical protein